MGRKKMLRSLWHIPVLAAALSVSAAIGDVHHDWDGRPAFPNLPVVQQMSKPVTQGDLEFQVVADSIWPIPSRVGNASPEIPAGESHVRLQLRVTNRRKKETRLLLMAGTPVLQSGDGKELPVRRLGANHTSIPKTISLEPGKTVTIKRLSQLSTFVQGSSLRLVWEDESGTVSEIEGLKAGKYLLRLHYEIQNDADEWSSGKESGAWLGNVRTAEIPIEIVDLNASRPVVCKGVEALSRVGGSWEFKTAAELGWKDDVEVMALADGVWKAPAPGNQTRVCLGYRMATADKSCAKLIPSIVGLSIKSADGVELPVRKTSATISMPEPQLLAVDSRYSQTMAMPACLFRKGNAMILAWADGTGQVWHVENLRPGEYSVRYVLRAEKGEPTPLISYWVGELRTASVSVEIKE